jgi:serine phosphatase RsbU (regulator of sigma subunit)
MTEPVPPIPTPADPRHSFGVSDAQMRMVLDVSRMLAVARELGPLLQRIAETCCGLIGCERASIFLHDEKTNQLCTRVALGSPEISVPAETGIVGVCFNSNQLIHAPAPYTDPRFNAEPDRRNGFVTRSLLACPLIDIDDKPLGVLEAVNKRGDAFTENDFAMIALLAEQAGVAIQRHRLQQDALGTVGLRHEMKLARRVQVALIPKKSPDIPGLSADGWSLPASTTGGDCFDLWKTPDGRLGILLADASGHGLAPALIVSQARTLIRAMADRESDPDRVLARTNARLCDDLNPSQFVTAFLAFIAPDGMIQWSSAGQGPVLVRRTIESPLTVLEALALPLGVKIPWSSLAPAPAQIDPTGSLILVSDGIFESLNAAEEMFGIDRMLALLDTHRLSRPAEISTALREAARDWRGDAEPADDQTIVIVQREASGSLSPVLRGEG